MRIANDSYHVCTPRALCLLWGGDKNLSLIGVSLSEPHLALLLDKICLSSICNVRHRHALCLCTNGMRWPAQVCINQSPLYSFHTRVSESTRTSIHRVFNGIIRATTDEALKEARDKAGVEEEERQAVRDKCDKRRRQDMQFEHFLDYKRKCIRHLSCVKDRGHAK